MTSTAEAEASAKGSSDSDDSSDDKSDKQVNDNANTAGKTGGGVPSSNDKRQHRQQQREQPVRQLRRQRRHRRGDRRQLGRHRQRRADRQQRARELGGTGLVKVSAKNQNDASAKAYGPRVEPRRQQQHRRRRRPERRRRHQHGVDRRRRARRGRRHHRRGDHPGRPSTNDFIVWGLAGAGGKSDFSVSASVGIQVINYETTAKVQKGADLESTGGHHRARDRVPRAPVARARRRRLDRRHGRRRIAIVVNIIEDFATAAFIDSGTGARHRSPTLDATGAIQVKAEAHLRPLVPIRTSRRSPAPRHVGRGRGRRRHGRPLGQRLDRDRRAATSRRTRTSATARR